MRQSAVDAARRPAVGPLALPLLLGCAAALWIGSSFLLDAFPVAVSVTADSSSLQLSADGTTALVLVSSPLRAVRFVPLAPNVREYQIDGSDTTNNFTFDDNYFAGIADSPYYRFQAFLRDEGSYSQWRNLSIRKPGGATLLEKADPEGEISLPEEFDLSVQLHRPETPRTLEFQSESGAVYGVELNRNDKYVQVTETAPGVPTHVVTRWYFPNEWQPPAAELVYMALRVAALAIFLLVLVAVLAAAIPVASFLLHGGTSRLATRASPTWLRQVGQRPVPRRRTDRARPWAGNGLPPHRPETPWRISWASQTPPAGQAAWETAIPLLAAAATLAAGCYSAVALFDRAPHILDAVSYYFQAKILASGAVAAPAPPVPEAFPIPFTIVRDGKWFSQYPPGTSLLLAAGFLLRLPWLVEPLLAAATTLILYRIGRRQYGPRVALLASVLIATSPFLWLMAGSFMSHVPSTFFAVVFLHAATRYSETPTRRWVVVAAVALGFGFLVREATAVLYAATVGSWVVWRRLHDHRQGMPQHLALAVAVLAPFGAAYLLYNWMLTGSPFVLPRLIFSPLENRFGFGDGIGFYGRHTPAAGLVNADEQLTSLTIVLFGWPFYFTLALMALPFLARLVPSALSATHSSPGTPNPERPELAPTPSPRPSASSAYRQWDLLHTAVVGAFIVAYVGFYYHGIVMGPRYYFDALPSMVLLSARGFATLAVAASSILSPLRDDVDWRPRALRAALVLAALLLACNLLYFTPRELELYRGYTGMPGGKGPELAGFVQRDLSGRKVDLPNALITTDDWWIYSVYLAPLNPPRADGGTVLALMPSDGEGKRLLAAYHGRNWYRVVLDPEGRLSLQWEGILGNAVSPR